MTKTVHRRLIIVGVAVALLLGTAVGAARSVLNQMQATERVSVDLDEFFSIRREKTTREGLTGEALRSLFLGGDRQTPPGDIAQGASSETSTRKFRSYSIFLLLSLAFGLAKYFLLWLVLSYLRPCIALRTSATWPTLAGTACLAIQYALILGFAYLCRNGGPLDEHSLEYRVYERLKSPIDYVLPALSIVQACMFWWLTGLTGYATILYRKAAPEAWRGVAAAFKGTLVPGSLVIATSFALTSEQAVDAIRRWHPHWQESLFALLACTCAALLLWRLGLYRLKHLTPLDSERFLSSDTVATLVSSALFVALGAGLVYGGANLGLGLLLQGDQLGKAPCALIAMGMSCFLAPAFFTMRRLERLRGAFVQPAVRVAAGLLSIVPIVAVVSPVQGPQFIGSLAIVFSFVGLLAGLLHLGDRLSEALSNSGRVQRLLASLSLSKLPFWTCLALLALAASIAKGQLLPRESNIGQSLIVRSNRPDLSVALARWKETCSQGTETCMREADGNVPLVVVSASGGGIRAAFWTATVLDELTRKTGLLPGNIFAISGVSGGSLGAFSFAAATAFGASTSEAKRALRQDYLSVILARMLMVELPALVLPIKVEDRGVWFDRALAESFSELGRLHLELWDPAKHTPIVIANAIDNTQARKLRISVLNLSAQSGASPESVVAWLLLDYNRTVATNAQRTHLQRIGDRLRMEPLGARITRLLDRSLYKFSLSAASDCRLEQECRDGLELLRTGILLAAIGRPSIRLLPRDQVDIWPLRLADPVSVEGQAEFANRSASSQEDLLLRDSRRGPEDLYDFLGPERDVTIATAGHLSARFPYISPSGFLPPRDLDHPPAYIVDGGYYENSGAATAIELQELLLRKGVQRIYHIHIDNGYSQYDFVDVKSYAPSELVIPVRTFLKTMEYNDGDARYRAQNNFASHKSCEVHLPATIVKAPLGWVLSDWAADAMENQSAKQLEQCQWLNRLAMSNRRTPPQQP